MESKTSLCIWYYDAFIVKSYEFRLVQIKVQVTLKSSNSSDNVIFLTNIWLDR